jgi:hypothetical protein
MTLLDVTTNTELTPYAWVTPDQDVTKILNTALDGTVYLQIIGAPVKYYDVGAVISSTDREALEDAEANGDLLSLTEVDTTLYGRIVELNINPKIIGGTQTLTMRLAKEVV